jgi:putative NIF3 family GTP cyclohydrolase 1 type 2
MLQAHSVAEEYRLNVIFAGHYATEVFGVRALGSLLEKHFAVKSEFLDLAVPY